MGTVRTNKRMGIPSPRRDKPRPEVLQPCKTSPLSDHSKSPFFSFAEALSPLPLVNAIDDTAAHGVRSESEQQIRNAFRNTVEEFGAQGNRVPAKVAAAHKEAYTE